MLLVALLAGMVIRPFFDNSIAASGIFTVYMAVVLLGSLYAIGIEDRVSGRTRERTVGRFVVAAVLGVIGMTGRVSLRTHHSRYLLLFLTVCWIVFLGIIAFAILGRTLRARHVTFDTISAALCVYMLIGLAWAFIYTALFVFDKGAFSFPHNEVLGTTTFDEAHHVLSALMYYSFVTLSTVGYGDITPVSSTARSFSALEAIFGQFYIAILVASLVGIRISQSMKDEVDEMREAHDER